MKFAWSSSGLYPVYEVTCSNKFPEQAFPRTIFQSPPEASNYNTITSWWGIGQRQDIGFYYQLDLAIKSNSDYRRKKIGA